MLEVAPDRTSRNDENAKWLDYANFRVREYWLFDSDWGKRYATGLAGWTLVNGRCESNSIRPRTTGIGQICTMATAGF